MVEKFLQIRLKEVVSEQHGEIVSIEKDKKNKMVYVTLSCGKNHTFSYKPRSIINGHWCPQCKQTAQVNHSADNKQNNPIGVSK